MKTVLRAGIATAAFVSLGLFAIPAHAADLGPYPAPQSYKPTYKPTYKPVAAPEAGNCYVRADAGGSYMDDFSADYNGATSGNAIEDSYVFEGGAGCGYGKIRADLTFGYRGERNITVIPPMPPQFNDPLTTSLETYTMMANFYYDIGHFNGFTPYVGAGVGVAYHEVADVYCTPRANNFCEPSVAQYGGETLSLAWSLMAGVGYDVSDNLTIDVGYRYIDLGKASSERADTAFFVNPALKLDDLDAHEIKAGFRYKFSEGGW